MPATLKYKADVYQGKIDELNSCLTQLQGHCDTMEDLKNAVNRFWNDPQAPKYLQALSKQITAVRTTMDNTQKLIREYNTAVAQITSRNELTDGLIDEINGTIDKVVGGVEAGASAAAGV